MSMQMGTVGQRYVCQMTNGSWRGARVEWGGAGRGSGFWSR